MHYYQFNIGDYASHTAHLDELEDLAFRRMLDWCYTHEIPLPKDQKEIGRLIRMRTHCDCIANVLREFFTLTDEGYINNRVMREVGEYKAKSEKAKKSAKARWSKNGDSLDANALRTECEGNAKHKTLNTKQEPLTRESKQVALTGANAPSRGSRLPDEFQLPRQWGEWALDNSNLNHEQIRREGEKFRDHWLSASGSKGVKKDWLATWRNWIRRTEERTDKTWAEKNDDYQNKKADERYKTLSTASEEELKAWGLL